MNIDKAGTEAFARYLDFETAFQLSFKIGIAALTHVERVVGGAGGPTIVRGLLEDTGESWRLNDGWGNPPEHLQRARFDASRLGIVQVDAAIDDFIVSLDAELTRWRAVAGNAGADGAPREPMAAADDDEFDRLESLCQRYDWDTTLFRTWRPLLQFFRVARNCIAHRSGTASSKLVELAESEQITEALARWARRRQAAPPPLPEIRLNSPIDLKPRHVILAVDAVRRACTYVNSCAVRALGSRGLIHLAAHQTLLADVPQVFTNAYLTPEAVINQALTKRYRATEVTPAETIELLRSLDKWAACRQAHTRIYGDPPRPLAV